MDQRSRDRVSAVRMVDGVPLPDPRLTDAVLSMTIVGQWLADQNACVRGRLLDLGCGGRPYAEWYSPQTEQVVTVDAAPTADCHVRAIGTTLPFPDDSFDTILCTDVLEHVEDPAAVCREMGRVLRPGGAALVTVPFVYPLHEAPYDFQRFTHFGLRHILTQGGLAVDTLQARGGPIVLGTQLLLLGLSRAVGLRRGGEGARPRTKLTVPLARAQAAFVDRSAGRRWYTEVSGLSALFSLGYMAVATKDVTDLGGSR